MPWQNRFPLKVVKAECGKKHRLLLVSVAAQFSPFPAGFELLGPGTVTVPDTGWSQLHALDGWASGKGSSREDQDTGDFYYITLHYMIYY